MTAPDAADALDVALAFASEPQAAGRDARGRPLSWSHARRVAARAGRSRDPLATRGRPTPLADCVGQVLAEPLAALSDLPAFDTAAMDGWAVAGPGPWRLAGAAARDGAAGGPNPADADRDGKADCGGGADRDGQADRTAAAADADDPTGFGLPAWALGGGAAGTPASQDRDQDQDRGRDRDRDRERDRSAGTAAADGSAAAGHPVHPGDADFPDVLFRSDPVAAAPGGAGDPAPAPAAPGRGTGGAAGGHGAGDRDDGDGHRPAADGQPAPSVRPGSEASEPSPPTAPRGTGTGSGAGGTDDGAGATAPGAGITAGAEPAPLADGWAVPIATGARLPAGATAVLRREDGATGADGRLRAAPTAPARPAHPPHGRPPHGPASNGHPPYPTTANAPTPGGRPSPAAPGEGDPAEGRDVRPRGSECRRGEHLLPEGTRVTPAVAALAAAAGHDSLPTVPEPAAAVLVLGDELLDSGRPRDARVRDSLGPLLAGWLPALGARLTGRHRVPDDPDALRRAIADAADAGADLVVTTGGTAAGPRDFVRPVLAGLGARLLADGVDVRPGHPMLLARLAGDRHLVGLPGNPLAAAAGVVTLVAPLLAARAGRPEPADPYAPLAVDVPPGGSGTRLLPAGRGPDGALRPLRHDGPAMLRALAAADALAVVPGAGARAGEPVPYTPLTWAAV